MHTDSCNSTSYLATTSFLSLALHIMSIVEIPTHIFGAYIIMFKTPPQMGSVKWPMMNVHVSSSLLDIYWSYMANPFIILPYLAGDWKGILSMLGVDKRLQIYIGISMIAVVGVTIIIFYENRYYVLSRKKNVWSKVRSPARLVIFALAWLFVAPYLFLVPDQEYAVPIVMKNVPCFQSYAPNIEIFVFSLDPVALPLTVIIAFTTELLVNCLLVALILKELAEQKAAKSISEKTLVLHRKFLFCLIVQIAIPFAVLVAPLLYIAYSVIVWYHNQVLNNFSFLVIALHGFLSTIVTLLVHGPYRKATLRMLGFWRKSERQVSVVSDKLVQNGRNGVFATP